MIVGRHGTVRDEECTERATVILREWILVLNRYWIAINVTTVLRGLCKVYDGAVGAKSNVECDALLLDETSRTDTYPYIEIDESTASIGHEATVSKVGDEQIFYLMSRGLDQAEAMAIIVRGFIEPVAKQLPLEYAIELNRLIDLEMEGSVG